jgi:hypothetical protein
MALAMRGKVPVDRPAVHRIVVKLEKLADEPVPILGLGCVDPTLDRLLSVKGNEAHEPRRQRVVIAEEMRVLVLQELDPQRSRQADSNALGAAHGVEQRVGQLYRADLPALGLDVDGTRRIATFERGHELTVERFLRRLRKIGQVSQQRSAMTRHRLEVEHLRPFAGERPDEPALPGACEAADNLVAKVPGKLRELLHDSPAIGAITAFELHGPPADLVHHVDERPAALPAPPAVDEGRPVARLRCERRLDHCREVARDDGGSGAPRREGRLLRMHRSNACALGVVEHRMIAGAGQVVLGVLRRTAHVDALAEVAEPRHGDRVVVAARG